MAVLRWMVGGIVGGAIGVAIWVLVGYATNYEVGWIAWGIGFLVGVGVRYGAHLGSEGESAAQGVVAALLAISSILTAKYLVFELVVGSVDAAAVREMIDDESLVVAIADEIAAEAIERNQPVTWPAGITYEMASEKDHYPPAIWRQAEAQWSGLGPVEQERRRDELAANVAELVMTVARPSFTETFAFWDLLWFGLATFTAFKIGAGSYGEE